MVDNLKHFTMGNPCHAELQITLAYLPGTCSERAIFQPEHSKNMNSVNLNINLRHLLTILLTGLFLNSLLAQEVIGEPEDIIPPSPTASALGKYGEVPVSTFTGTANISIPLYELPGRGLSVPVSVSYHSSGVKVEETASWVGMGWSLNAGGVITRSVKSRPDEDTRGIFWVNSTGGLPYLNEIGPKSISIPMTDPDYQRIEDMVDNDIDTEPDSYYFNFLGRSGKLTFDNTGECHSVPHQNLKFEQTVKDSNVEWIIKDESGHTYYFGSSTSSNGIEYTKVNDDLPNVTAWYLTKVVTNRNETIDFTYKYKFVTTQTPSSQTYSWYHPTTATALAVEPLLNLPGELSSTYMNNVSSYGEAILEKITSDLGEVQFTTSNDRDDLPGGVRLTGIEAFNIRNQSVKNYTLNYEYPSAHHERLYLTGIQELSELGPVSAHTFDYYSNDALPLRSSKQQDYWGYFNGQINNQHLIGTSFNANRLGGFIKFPASFQFANRDTDPSKVHIGSLSRINYPTGGYTDIEYEANEAIPSPNFLSAPTQISLARDRGNYGEETFTVDINQQVGVEVFFDSFRDVDNYRRPVAKLEKYENSAWVEVYSWRPDYPSLEDKRVYTNVYVQAGEYRLIADSEDCAGLQPCNIPPGLPGDFYAVEIDLDHFQNTNLTTIKVGGVRVKKVAHYDQVGSSVPKVSRYEYQPGVLVSTPEYAYQYLKEFCNMLGGFDGQTCVSIDAVQYNSASSHSYAVLGASNGSHVVYPDVTEKLGDLGEFGSSVYRYGLEGRHGDSLKGMYKTTAPFVPTDWEDYLVGQLISKVDFNSDGEKTSSTINQYQNGGDTVNYHFADGIKLMKSVYGSSMMSSTHLSFYFDKYKTRSKWVYMKASERMDYDIEDQTVGVSSFTQYDYDPVHLNPHRTITIESDGGAKIQENYYPTDYSHINSGTLFQMRGTKHQHNSVIESLSKEADAVFDAQSGLYIISNESVIDGKYVEYDQTTNGIIYPKQIYDLETSVSLTDGGSNELIYSVDDGTGSPDALYYSNVPERTDRYDDLGNLVERVARSGLIVCYVWGYSNGIYPIAKIEDVTYTELEAAAEGIAANFLTTLRNESDESQIALKLGQLRSAINTSLSKARMTSYRYKPGIGLTEVTDYNGLTTSYEYDKAGRLDLIKDHEGYVLKQYEYNYRTQNNQ